MPRAGGRGTGDSTGRPEGGAGWVDVAEMARRMGCTEANIRYWIKRGAPHRRMARQGPTPGVRLEVEPEGFAVWVRGARASPNVGGARPAGSVVSGGVASVSAAGGDGATNDAALDPETPEEIRRLVRLDRVDLDKMLIAERVFAERVKRQALEGTLVSVEAARGAWLRACNAAGRRLRDLPRAAAAAVCERLGVASTAANVGAARDALERQVEALCGQLREGGLAGLDGAAQREQDHPDAGHADAGADTEPGAEPKEPGGSGGAVNAAARPRRKKGRAA